MLIVEIEMFDWDNKKLGASHPLPLELDLREGLEPLHLAMIEFGWKYKLFAFVSCKGSAFDDCMYEAVVHKKDDGWVLYNSGTKRITEKQALNDYEPQIVFYRLVKT